MTTDSRRKPVGWDKIVLETAHSLPEVQPLIHSLLAQQRLAWPLFRDGEIALSQFSTRRLSHGSARVIVQANPGRRRSCYAKPDEVSSRPCFLCPENLPSEERGIAYHDFIFLPNPFPILPNHLTIPQRKHGPQALNRAEIMLEIAEALGPNMFVFYNGPRCGASAPDHFHFQAAASAEVPLFKELPIPDLTAPLMPFQSFGRAFFILHGHKVEHLALGIYRIMDAMSGGKDTSEEPLVNVVATFREKRHLVLVFPRSKHRPEVFSAPEPARIALSPAAVEMMGVLVVAEKEHMERLTENVVQSIYHEVSLKRNEFQTLLERLI